MGCWAIACSVELGLTTRAGNTLDFYLCWRYNPSCQSARAAALNLITDASPVAAVTFG